jgi:hypothetical protein
MVNSIAKYTVDLDINDINHKKVKPKTTRTKYVARANSPSSSMANGKNTPYANKLITVNQVAINIGILTINKKISFIIFSFVGFLDNLSHLH